MRRLLSSGVLVGLALLGGCARRSTTPRPVPGLGPEQVDVWLPPAKEFCADVHLLSLEELARGDGAGEVVAVEGVPRVSARCTDAACLGPDGRHDPSACCNECQGGYVLDLEEAGALRLRVTLEGAGECSGFDCNFACTPFGRKPTRAYRFVGLNSFTPAGESGAAHAKSIFAVERVCNVQEGVATPR